MSRLAEFVRFQREPTAIEMGLLAGCAAAIVIFATRLFTDDLAIYLFKLSHGF